MNTFQGTGVAVVTPFQADHSIDLPALRLIVDHLIAGQVDYLVVLGTTGESATLSTEEKQLVIETILDQNQGRLPIVLGVGGNNTATICRQVSQYSSQFPLNGILSVSPYYNKPSQEGIYQHYQAVAGATDLPIILYNVPGRTASNMTAETTLRLANNVENIVATKEASGDLTQCMEIIRQKPLDFQVISGDDIFALPLVSLGGAGLISVTANAFPALMSEMVSAALAGEYTKARNLHYQLLPLFGCSFAEGNPTGVKAQMSQLNLCQEWVRLPLVPASESLQGKIKAAIQEMEQQPSSLVQ